ncbi:hypothetical protein [Hymenobacter sp. BRD67]|uniref:hypothetical protein n=1 Tax=Hymenobacter sp. BRD67 TaxID=2675877 RepID=UPI001564A182|nr:hypothetical protein [Hymenobacter sp. BRD67]QKG52402.1 hypothetical protein GKZ67_07020 [Hymenobacter sp. BRD67]
MDLTTLDFQQARIKQILFKSPLRSVLYGVRVADDTLFSPRTNAIGQWIATVVKPRHPARIEVRNAERLLHQMLAASSTLVAQYSRGQIEEARRGLSQIDSLGEQLVAQLEALAKPGPAFAAA